MGWGWDLPAIIRDRYALDLKTAEQAVRQMGGRGRWWLKPPQPPLARLAPTEPLQEYRSRTIQPVSLDLELDGSAVRGRPSTLEDREIIAGWATSLLGDLLDEHRRDIKRFVAVLDDVKAKDGVHGDG